MDNGWVAIIQAVMLIPMAYLFALSRALSMRLDNMQREYFDKNETLKMIELHQEPVKVELANINQNIKDLKGLLQRLVDDKSK